MAGPERGRGNRGLGCGQNWALGCRARPAHEERPAPGGAGRSDRRWIGENAYFPPAVTSTVPFWKDAPLVSPSVMALRALSARSVR